MEALIDQFGEAKLMLAAGISVGALFGFAAYRSRFCLRAAAVEVAQGQFGPKLAIWLVAFLTALASVQLAIVSGFLQVSEARQIAATGSMSGAIIGGLMFGAGMILARGCASRLLVLSASGNLRAIVTGLVLTLVAQASLRGVLAPLRETLANLWTIDGGRHGRLCRLADHLSDRPILVRDHRSAVGDIHRSIDRYADGPCQCARLATEFWDGPYPRGFWRRDAGRHLARRGTDTAV